MQWDEEFKRAALASNGEQSGRAVVGVHDHAFTDVVRAAQGAEVTKPAHGAEVTKPAQGVEDTKPKAVEVDAAAATAETKS